MNLFQLGNFVLNSGAKSKFKLECDALTNEDIEALAYMISTMVGPFGYVEGIPRGGLRLAKALEQYITPIDDWVSFTRLIVDDVLTTGRSMENARIKYQNNTMSLPVKGVVIFARGKCPDWITPVFQMTEPSLKEKGE
jgi:orotate phosphoribosyltransferase